MDFNTFFEFTNLIFTLIREKIKTKKIHWLIDMSERIDDNLIDKFEIYNKMTFSEKNGINCIDRPKWDKYKDKTNGKQDYNEQLFKWKTCKEKRSGPLLETFFGFIYLGLVIIFVYFGYNMEKVSLQFIVLTSGSVLLAASINSFLKSIRQRTEFAIKLEEEK